MEAQISKFSREELIQRMMGNAEVNRRFPAKATLELCFNCNLQCQHCYCPRSNGKKLLSIAEIKGIVDELTEMGCLQVLLTGGEPLMRSDFFEIYKYIKLKGLVISLFTNATLISTKHVSFFKDYPPASIEISMFGLKEKTYDRVTRTPGAYRKFKRGFELLMKAGFDIKLKSLATIENFNEIIEIEKFAKEHKLPFRFDSTIFPKLDRDESPKKVRLPVEKVIELDKLSEGRMEDFKSVYEKTKGSKLGNSFLNCQAGVNSLVIDPYGNMFICQLFRLDGYNLREGSVKDGFYNHFPKIFMKTKQKELKCYNCSLLALCSNCVAWGYLETGEAESVVDYLCQIANARKAEFDNMEGK